MSFSIGVHLWWDENQGGHFEHLRGVLNCIPLPRSYREFDGSEVTPTRFNRVRVYAPYFDERLDQYLQTNDSRELLRLVENYPSESSRFLIDGAFNFLEYDPRTEELFTSAGPLGVEFFGPLQGVTKDYYERYGLVEVSFLGLSPFQIDPSLLNDRNTHPSHGTGKNDELIRKLQANYDEAVLNLSREIIKATDPKHLLICTEREVHPLTAHGIYHRESNDFITDLEKIASLHEFGGVYFCKANSDDISLPPRKSSLDYGYLRGPFGTRTASLFARKLQPIVDAVLNGSCSTKITRNELENVLYGSQTTTTFSMLDSYLLTAQNSPFAYIEEPYFKLFRAIMEPQLSAN
jgi:hypothetical protein